MDAVFVVFEVGVGKRQNLMLVGIVSKTSWNIGKGTTNKGGK